MPKAVDKHPQKRGTGNALFNPLRNGVASYEDPLSAIDSDMAGIGGEFRGLFSAIGKIFGLPSPEEILAGVANGIGAVVQGATDLIAGFGGFFGRLIGGFLDVFQIPVLDPSKILNLPNVLVAFWNSWFRRSDGTGSPAEVTFVLDAIRTAVIDGATVYGFAFDEVNWPVRVHSTAKGLVFGGGQSGAAGAGGLHGSVLGGPVDFTDVTHVDIQIGTAGNRTYIRKAATPPHTGEILMQSPVHGTAGGGIAELGLLTPTTSLPGNGGNGGSGGPDGTSSTAGQSTPMAAGGNGGGSGFSGSNGQPGGSASVNGEIKCGGAGGGGGGRATGPVGGGGNGGAGGYPGGAGGGRGQGWSGGSNGSVGPGAPGVAFLYFR